MSNVLLDLARGGNPGGHDPALLPVACTLLLLLPACKENERNPNAPTGFAHVKTVEATTRKLAFARDGDAELFFGVVKRNAASRLRARHDAGDGRDRARAHDVRRPVGDWNGPRR